MRQQIKKAVRATGLYRKFRRWKSARSEKRHGHTDVPQLPSASIKSSNLIELAKKHRTRIFVETGTYTGDTVEAVRSRFDRVVSIELDPLLHERAKHRFRTATNVELIQGDSGEELGKVLATIREPALFWLDGHYSGGITAWSEEETPILSELAHIFAHDCPGHVIVIDDARLFGSDTHYPTIEKLTSFVRSRLPDVEISVMDDAIRIEPHA